MKFKDYHFLKEQSESNGLTDGIRSYIDSKFSEIESKLQEMSPGKYNVIPSGNGLLDVIDIDSRSVAGKLSYQGELISAPVVHGDRVSFGIQKGLTEDTMEVLGVIYELPSGINVGNFRVEQEHPGAKYQKTMGTEEVEEEHVDADDEKDDKEQTADDVETKDHPELPDISKTTDTTKDDERDEEIEQLKRDIAADKAERAEEERERERKEREKPVTTAPDTIAPTLHPTPR